MNNETIFATWAPEHSLWSTWTKPVLFAHLGATRFLPEPPAPASAAPVPPLNLDWCPPAVDKVALVVDLPGAEGVLLGVALAERGYRPVPLYNALPMPGVPPLAVDEWDPHGGPAPRFAAVVNVLPILIALCRQAEKLAALSLPANAPPAFLLDARRQGDGYTPNWDAFDNRFVCFTTDFPSANFLLAHGFRRALLVQQNQPKLSTDLAQVLRRWQDGGLALQILRSESDQPERLLVPRPAWYGAMFQRALSAFGLPRARDGGFGAWMTSASG